MVVVSLAAVVAFFSCLLLHELSHSMVATRCGTRVRSITLFLFGGVSDIEHEPPAAGVAQAEIKLAIDNALAGHTVADLMTRTVRRFRPSFPCPRSCTIISFGPGRASFP